MSAATDALEELNELLRMEEQRRADSPEDKRPSELAELAQEIRTLTETVTEAVADSAAIALTPEGGNELTDILTEMKMFNGRVVQALARTESPAPVMPMQPAPIVSVQPPNVSVSPSINIQRNYTRFRVTVTKRDASAQMRIQELIIEPIE